MYNFQKKQIVATIKKTAKVISDFLEESPWSVVKRLAKNITSSIHGDRVFLFLILLMNFVWIIRGFILKEPFTVIYEIAYSAILIKHWDKLMQFRF